MTKKIIFSIYLLFIAFGVAFADDKPIKNSDAKRIQDAEAFARTLVDAALPGKHIEEQLITHNLDKNAVHQWGCDLSLKEHKVVEGWGAETPERACYMTVERAKALYGRNGS